MTSKSLMAKAKKTPTLEKRLLAYSAVATAALLTSQPAEAAIQLTTSGATISGSTLAITFGGNTKFTIRQGLTAALNYQAVGIIKGSTGAFWAGGTVQPFGVPYSYAKAFNAGVSVKTQTPGYQGGFPYSSGNMAYTNKGQFNNVNNKYLGVKFKIGANTHYGWILVSCPNPTATSVTVHKWAYNDTPDGAILTGQEPPANAVPTVTVNNGAYTEDAGPTVIDSAATANDADGDGDWDTGAKLEVQITTNAEAADEISIDTSGNFSIATPNLSYSGVGVIGTISEASGTANDGTVTGGAMLTINLNASATNAIIQELTRAIAYRSTSNNPTGTNTTRTVTFTLTDKNAGTGNDTSTITITPINDDPTDIALDNANVSEEQPSNTVVGTLTITDPDN